MLQPTPIIRYRVNLELLGSEIASYVARASEALFIFKPASDSRDVASAAHNAAKASVVISSVHIEEMLAARNVSRAINKAVLHKSGAAWQASERNK